MPTSEQAERLIKINDMLVGQVTTLNRRIETLNKKQEHTQWAVTAVSGVLAIIVIIGGWTKLNHVDDKVDKSFDAQLATCESQNISRAESKSRWDKNAMAIKALAPGVASVQKYADDTRAQAAKTFGQKDCSQINQGKSPTYLPTTPPIVPAK
jgi:hypothetical protein